jgi:hypothetical protein
VPKQKPVHPVHFHIDSESETTALPILDHAAQAWKKIIQSFTLGFSLRETEENNKIKNLSQNRQ